MKKITVLIVSICTLLSVSSFAQETVQKGNKLDRLKSTLNLSDAQVNEVKLLFKETRKEAKAIKSNEALTKPDKKEQLLELRESKDVQMEAILDAEQYDKFLEMKEQKKTLKADERQKRKEEALKELGLTDSQALRLKEIKEESKAKRRELKENSNLTEAERKTAFKELKAETDLEVKALLTHEQYEKLKELKQKRRENRKMEKKPVKG